jgi:hypothetical protein
LWRRWNVDNTGTQLLAKQKLQILNKSLEIDEQSACMLTGDLLRMKPDGLNLPKEVKNSMSDLSSASVREQLEMLLEVRLEAKTPHRLRTQNPIRVNRGTVN